MKRSAIGGMATLALFCLLCSSRIAAQQVTFNAQQNGQAAPGVSIVFVAANKIKTQTPATPTAETNTISAVTNSSGVSVLDFSNKIKIKTNEKIEVQLVVRKCEDGKTVVYVVQKGAQVPPQDEKCVNTDNCKCKDYVAGAYFIGGGDTVTVNITPGAVNVQVTQGTGTSVTSNQPKTHIPVFVQVGGGAGFKNFRGISGNCASYTQIFPGGTCSNSTNSAAFDVDAALHLWHAVVNGGYFRANNIQLNASGPVPGGTDTLKSTLQPDAGYVTGGFWVPLGGKFSLFPHVGAALWRINTKRTETVTTGSSTTTSTDSGQVTGTGPMAGVAVHMDVTRVVGFEVRYDWVQMSHKPLVNEHNNLLLFNVTFRWPRK